MSIANDDADEPQLSSLPRRSTPEKQEGGGKNTIYNIKHLTTFRKELRNQLTPAEASLWKLLKNKQLDGRKFRRQHSVGNYILDFYCPEEQLAIELDGEGHFTLPQKLYDDERDLFLRSYNVKVLRFENCLVWEKQEWLIDRIRSEFGWFIWMVR